MAHPTLRKCAKDGAPATATAGPSTTLRFAQDDSLFDGGTARADFRVGEKAVTLPKKSLGFDEDVAVALLDVLVEDDLELFYDAVAFEGGEELAVDVDGGFGLLEGAGEGDADVGVLGFAGAVDDAAHDGEFELFDAGVLLLPLGHGFDEVGLDALGELLEVGGGGAAAAGATGDLGHEGADAEGLEDLLAAADLFGAVAAWGGGEADADGVTDAGEEQGSEAGGGGDDAFHAHACLGEAEVEGVVAAAGELGVDVD